MLDRIVPGYYHRLSADGEVENSTCCANTAPEHAMMGKLMVDSVVTWAREYKVDGFRFDLMGHHPKANMLAVRRRAGPADPRRRTASTGRSIYLYGEGWNFGEVADNARFVQATQANMAGTGIGTFNDRLRDAVRGGGPFDDDPRIQGFAHRPVHRPQRRPVNGTTGRAAGPAAALPTDLIKVGLAGNLRDYPFVDRTGATVHRRAGRLQRPAGRLHRRAERGDHLRRRARQRDPVRRAAVQAAAGDLDGRPGADEQGRAGHHRARRRARVLARRHRPAALEVAGPQHLQLRRLVQPDRLGLPGSTWGSGLPPAADNQDKWSYMRAAAGRPGAGAAAGRHPDRPRPGYAELLRIRFSSPLFRLGSATLVQQRVAFPTGGPAQTPGVIVMALDDRGRAGPRPERPKASSSSSTPQRETTTQTVPGASPAPRYTLHPVQNGGGDPVVRAVRLRPGAGAFTVPARTVAVFVTS